MHDQATGYSNDYKIYQSLFHICHTHEKNEKEKIEKLKAPLSIHHCALCYSIDFIIGFCKFCIKKPTLFHKNETIGPEIRWIEYNGKPRSFTCDSKRDCNNDSCSFFLSSFFLFIQVLSDFWADSDPWLHFIYPAAIFPIFIAPIKWFLNISMWMFECSKHLLVYIFVETV